MAKLHREPEQVSVTLISPVMDVLQHRDESCVESEQLRTNAFIIRYTVISAYLWDLVQARRCFTLDSSMEINCTFERHASAELSENERNGRRGRIEIDVK